MCTSPYDVLLLHLFGALAMKKTVHGTWLAEINSHWLLVVLYPSIYEKRKNVVFNK